MSPETRAALGSFRVETLFIWTEALLATGIVLLSQAAGGWWLYITGFFWGWAMGTCLWLKFLGRRR